jgi:alpha-1,2-mannosyltransferase
MLRMVVTGAAIAAMLSAAYSFIVVPLTGTFGGPFEDFAVYSGAARAVANGASPYASFDSSSIVMAGFDYPPFAALVLRPLAFLSDEGQELLWLWVSLAALVGGAIIVARALLPRAWPGARIAVFVALTFPPATYNLWHGQMNTIIFLLLALALRDYLSEHRTRCGIILGVAASIKLAPILLLVVLVRRGWWRGVAAGAASAAVTVAVGIAALGWPVTAQYLSSVVPVLSRDNGWIYNQTWNGVINRLAEHSVLTAAGGLRWVSAAVTLLSIATVAAVLLATRRWARTRAERGAEFACGVVAMLLIGTVAWYPVYVHLLIALAAALGLAHERGVRHKALVAWTATAVLGIGVAGAAVIADLTLTGVATISRGPLWWLFLQACSLPALLAAGLLISLVSALRCSPSPQALRPRRGSLDVAAGVPLRDGLALVPQLLAASQPELQFDPVAPEVDAQRDQREPLLGDLGPEVLDLALVQ